jgi:hypothetical protein
VPSLCVTLFEARQSGATVGIRRHQSCLIANQIYSATKALAFILTVAYLGRQQA